LVHIVSDVNYTGLQTQNGNRIPAFRRQIGQLARVEVVAQGGVCGIDHGRFAAHVDDFGASLHLQVDIQRRRAANLQHNVVPLDRSKTA
jgi:hypothetical protein